MSSQKNSTKFYMSVQLNYGSSRGENIYFISQIMLVVFNPKNENRYFFVNEEKKGLLSFDVV